MVAALMTAWLKENSRINSDKRNESLVNDDDDDGMPLCILIYSLQ